MPGRSKCRCPTKRSPWSSKKGVEHGIKEPSPKNYLYETKEKTKSHRVVATAKKKKKKKYSV
jgi:hypothetical protein